MKPNAQAASLSASASQPTSQPEDLAAQASAQPIKAMILCAGRGERMWPLTDHCPKPLLPLRGKPLMQWAMEALARQGYTEQVINTAWLGQKIVDHFGPKVAPILNTSLPQSERIRIQYSNEGQDFGMALETAGGIARALPLLGEHFWVLAGDVFAPEFPFAPAAVEKFIASGHLAHLWLVPNPPQHPRGDFGISADGLALSQAAQQYTYSTLGLYHRALFAPPYCSIPFGNPAGERAALAPLLRQAMNDGRVSAELYQGMWADVGTPERLAALAGEGA